MQLQQKIMEGDYLESNAIMDEDTQHGRYLSFALGDESYGLEISHVIEIVGIQPITPIPEAPDYVRGIINLRGQIVPVIDVHLKFGSESKAYDDRTCIIIIDIEGLSAGLIVDRVSEVLTIGDGDIVPPPDYRTGAQNHYIKAIGKVGNEIKLLLDCNKLFDVEEIDSLQNIG
jgi:purine-binding chemotaxis protein CheW